MELRQIEYFTSVIELKSFSLAAQKLFVTQPTITMSIKSLENELGLPLIDRSQRSITMTEAGEMFYQSAKVILNDVNDTLLRMETLKHKFQKTISIGVAVRSCSKLLPSLFEKLPELQPDFDIEVKEMISPDIYKAVLEQHLDYGLCILPHIIDPHLGVEALLDGHIRILLSSSHPLASIDHAIPLDLICNETVFVYRSNNSSELGMTEVIFDAAFKKKGLKHHNIISMADSYTLMCMVAAGKGVCLMPDTSSQYMLMMPNTVLKSIETENGSDTFSVGLIYTKKSSDSKITKALVSHFKGII